MSRMTVAINLINEDLQSVSGLGGKAEDYIMMMQSDIHNRIKWLLSLDNAEDEQ